MKKIEIDNLKLDFINEMQKSALLLSGTKNNYNMMTIGWALEGILWSKKVIMVFVKPSRYTHKFMEENEYFTINFFNNHYLNELKLLGTTSGRDYDKLDLVGFHLLDLNESLGLIEADKIIKLKKIYTDKFNENDVLNEVFNKYYKCEEPHSFYIGEIIEVIDNTIN